MASSIKEPPAITIVIPPAAIASNIPVLTRLVDIINVAFSEQGTFFHPTDNVLRCAAPEIRQYLEASELCLAWQPDSSQTDAQGLVGCARVSLLDDGRTALFGVLACDDAFRGLGVGRDLMVFAEDRARKLGAKTMRIDLLYPHGGWVHGFKERLAEWYERQGYRVVKVVEVGEVVPELVPRMAREAVFRIYEKELRERGW
ncbi:hypothetical protein B0T17DRAFT_184370 [Bombardia bombarda]|uniref:N-acetyltransferase domain-containing protein n=1 Tax=Bombardia bombarda TaxID=252184 RepID=A0AA39X8P6_9PEZI|nr:hypothetical protein B0T17DRAFT_184370 [Bombardia bombarda]